MKKIDPQVPNLPWEEKIQHLSYSYEFMTKILGIPKSEANDLMDIIYEKLQNYEFMNFNDPVNGTGGSITMYFYEPIEGLGGLYFKRLRLSISGNQNGFYKKTGERFNITPFFTKAQEVGTQKVDFFIRNDVICNINKERRQWLVWDEPE